MGKVNESRMSSLAVNSAMSRSVRMGIVGVSGTSCTAK